MMQVLFRIAAIALLCTTHLSTQAQNGSTYSITTNLTWSNHSIRDLTIPEQTKTFVKLGVKSIWVTVTPDKPDRLHRYLSTPEIKSGELSIDIVRLNTGANWNYKRETIESLLKHVEALDLPLWVYITGKKNQRAKAAALFKQFCEHADEYNIDIVIYPHAAQIFRNAMDSYALINELGMDNLKLAVMWCHEVKTGDYEHIGEIMDKVAPHVAIASINGADEKGVGGGINDWRFAIMPLDRGNIDPKPFLDALAKHKFDGAILHKCWGIKDAADDYIPRSNSKWARLIAPHDNR